MVKIQKCNTLTPKEALIRISNRYFIEEKLDGFRVFFDGLNLISERGNTQNEKFPHILNELRDLDVILDGEVSLPDKFEEICEKCKSGLDGKNK